VEVVCSHTCTSRPGENKIHRRDKENENRFTKILKPPLLTPGMVSPRVTLVEVVGLAPAQVELCGSTPEYLHHQFKAIPFQVCVLEEVDEK